MVGGPNSYGRHHPILLSDLLGTNQIVTSWLDDSRNCYHDRLLCLLGDIESYVAWQHWTASGRNRNLVRARGSDVVTPSQERTRRGVRSFPVGLPLGILSNRCALEVYQSA